MFKCRECESTRFKLMLQSSFKGQVEVYNNANREVVIKVDDKEFIADLMFMNQFAICISCENIRCWEYYFPQDICSTSANDV